MQDRKASLLALLLQQLFCTRRPHTQTRGEQATRARRKTGKTLDESTLRNTTLLLRAATLPYAPPPSASECRFEALALGCCHVCLWLRLAGVAWGARLELLGLDARWAPELEVAGVCVRRHLCLCCLCVAFVFGVDPCLQGFIVRVDPAACWDLARQREPVLAYIVVIMVEPVQGRARPPGRPSSLRLTRLSLVRTLRSTACHRWAHSSRVDLRGIVGPVSPSERGTYPADRQSFHVLVGAARACVWGRYCVPASGGCDLEPCSFKLFRWLCSSCL